MKSEKYWIAAIFIGFSAFIFCYSLVHHIRCITFPYPLEYREGVVQYWVNRFIQDEPLYPKIDENFIHNPYTPSYYVIAGLFQKILPKRHIFFAGRLLNFFCLIVTGFLIFKVVMLQNTRIYAGLLAAGFFLCSPISINYGSIETVDMLGLSLAICGVYLAKRKTKLSLSLSGIFCALCFLTKITFILPGISVLIATLIAKEKKNYFISAFAGVLLIIFTSLFFRYKENIFTHLLLFNILPFSLSHFLNVFSTVGIRHCFLFGFLALYTFTLKDKKDPIYWYCALSPVLLLLSAKTGSEANYFLELVALSSVAAGLMFEKIGKFEIFLPVCISQIFLFLPFNPAAVFTRTYGQEVPAAVGSQPTKTLMEAGEIIYGELMSVSDPVLSEDTGWLVATEKNVIIEPYQFTQLVKTGRLDESPFIQMLEEKRFNLILISSESYEGHTEKFTCRMLESIKTNYQIKRVIGSMYILEPVFWSENDKTGD